jgi:hypothetical protein
MGKKRIAIVGEETKKERKVVKTGKEHGRITDMGAEALAEAERIKKKEEELEKISPKTQKEQKRKKVKPTKKRSLRYLQALTKVDRNLFYPLPEAIKILKNTSISKFNGAVDAHLVVSEVGLKGEVKFPHPTGKKQAVRIADEELLGELEKGKIKAAVNSIRRCPKTSMGLAAAA